MSETPILILPHRPRWVARFARAWPVWAAEQGAPLAALLAAADAPPDAEAAHDAAVARLAAPAIALSPTDTVRLILRDVLGLRIDGDALRWHLLEAPPCGIRRLPIGAHTVSLHALTETGGGLVVEVATTRPLSLDIETVAASFSEPLPAGRSRLLLTHLDRTDVRRAEP